MPRVSIKRKEYKLKDIKGWVAMQMKLNHMRQADIGEALGISQSRVSQILKVPEKGQRVTDDFTYGDLLTLCELFGTEGEEKQRLLTL